MSKKELYPIEKHKLLAEKIFHTYKKDNKAPTGEILREILEEIVTGNIDNYLASKELPASSKSKYKINKKDPYFIISPKREDKTNQTISQPKFEFFWHHFNMDEYVSEKVKDRPENYFFDSIKEYIYKGTEANGSLAPGHYVLKRMSLNADFKDHIVVIRLWVFEDKNALGETVLRYKTVNAYHQDSNEQNYTYERIRTSEGYVLKNQYNTLLMGTINYSHLSETEGSKTPNHYPEIISIHTARQYSRVSLGFSLANYPFYKTPSITQCYIEKIENYSYSYDEYIDNEVWKNAEPSDDTFIGVKKPTEKELSYLNFVLSDAGHKNILIPINS